MEMKTYEIWMEGYRMTGNSGKASFLGDYKGESFADACRNRYKDHDSTSTLDISADGTVSYWGCRLFDNEADARRRFG